MKNIKVNCIAFLYSCVRKNSDYSVVLMETINRLVQTSNVTLIIIDDSSTSGMEKISDEFRLNASENIIMCNRASNSWHYKDMKENKMYRTRQGVSIDLALSAIQKRFNIHSDNTITIGCRQSHSLLLNYSKLFFYVGEAKELRKKTRHLVPLTGQYEYGVNNLINYFEARRFVDNAFDYTDLIDGVRSYEAYYRQIGTPKQVYQKHRDVVKYLLGEFETEIAAIFSTAYPFYMTNCFPPENSTRTPDSILRYFEIQSSYFKQKIISEKEFLENHAEKITKHSLLIKYGVEVRRNTFDNYMYEKMGYTPPAPSADNLTLDEYYQNNCFDIISDVWPCFYCSTLKNSDLFQDQLTIKDPNISCLKCHQTSLLLRNVMACASDVDLVIVVKDDMGSLSAEIKNNIVHKSPFYIDSFFHRTFKDKDGPLDLFVTEESLFLQSQKKLVKSDWVHTSFDAIALWSPNVECQFGFGLDFVLAFEPQYISSKDILEQFKKTRKEFATVHNLESVIKELRVASFYTEQLLSNKIVRDNIKNKLSVWKTFPEMSFRLLSAVR